MERFGLVGLPNAGKSSLYNALTGGGALAAPYAFATKDPNVGVAKVPDHRLDALAEMSKSRNVVPAAVQVVDIGGLVEGASKGEGLGNRFLGGIREVDAIVFVLRAFEDDDVPGPDRSARAPPHRGAGAGAGRPGDRRGAARPAPEGGQARPQPRRGGGRARGRPRALAEGRPLYRAGLDAKQPRAARALGSCSRTSRCWPSSTSARTSSTTLAERGGARCGPSSASAGDEIEVLGLSVQLEAEAAQLTGDDRAEMLDALGLGEGALARLVRSAYHLLGLRTFLTTGDKESRAWTFRAGAKAPECAGVIHTDLQRGFIRAEVIHWDDLLEIGSWNKAKELGKLRVEGKDYEVVDGDVLEIRFNV